MKTIAISNQKGGVGKTTTAVSLSVALARQGKRVLLIDADSQADATKYLGVENPDELQNTLSTAMHCIINDLPYKTGEYIQSHPEGLDFVPSSIDLSSVEVELVNAMSRERILKTFLDDVRGKYDYVLIDCPPSLGMMPINALSAADSVLIPVQAQYFSMRGLLQLIRTIDKVQRRQNPHLKIEGIVLTLVDNRTNLSRDVAPCCATHMKRMYLFLKRRSPCVSGRRKAHPLEKAFLTTTPGARQRWPTNSLQGRC